MHVELLDADEGDEVTLDAACSSSTATPCSPRPTSSTGVTVTGKVVGEAKGPKINGFTYKNKRTNQRKRCGHRQKYTVVEITGISEPRRKELDRCRRPRVAVPPATAVTPTPSASA